MRFLRIVFKKCTFARNRKGFTLVEFVLYMGIFSMLLMVLTEIFLSVIDVQLESESQSSIQQDGQYILSRLTHDIQRADSIIIPAAPGEQGDILQILIDGINYSYSLDTDGNLILTDSEGSHNLNSYNSLISGLSFLRLGNVGGKNSIQASYTVTSKTVRVGGGEDQSFQTTITLR